MEFNREKFFLLMLTVVFSVISYSLYIGVNQNNIYIIEANRYLAVHKSTNKDMNYLITEINYFQNKDKENYMFFLDKAAIYRNNNRFEESQKELTKALKKRPLLEDNINFLYLYGETLYLSKDFENAKKYLIKAKTIDEESEYIESINEMLDKIEQEI